MSNVNTAVITPEVDRMDQQEYRCPQCKHKGWVHKSFLLVICPKCKYRIKLSRNIN